MVAVLVIIAVVCFAAGVVAASRWLPDLDDGPLGTIAFFTVCGLCGVALALVGINIDAMVRDTRHTSGAISATIINSDLVSMLRDSGTVAGLALIAYLLAPEPQSEVAAPTAEPSYVKGP